MRISTFQIFNNITRGIQEQMERLYLEEERLTSGKKINRPSDNSINMAKILDYRLELNQYEQFKKNISSVTSYLEATDGALSNLTDILARVRELAITSLNDTFSKYDRIGIAEEVSQLRLYMLGLANTRYQDRYIFSGMLYDRPAFDSSGNYQGDTNYIKVQISPTMEIKENIIGLDAFAYAQDKHEVVELENGRYIHYIPGQNINPADPEKRVYIAIAKTDDKTVVENELKSGTTLYVEDYFSFDNMIQMLDELNNALNNNNTDRINALVGAVDKAVNAVSESRAEIGARMNLIDNEKKRAMDEVVTLRKRLSEIEDADVTEVISNIAKYQTALEALRKSGAQIISQSLLDFLR